MGDLFQGEGTSEEDMNLDATSDMYDNAMNAVQNAQNMYNKVNDILSNIGTNKEGGQDPSSSNNNDSTQDSNNSDDSDTEDDEYNTDSEDELDDEEKESSSSKDEEKSQDKNDPNKNNNDSDSNKKDNNDNNDSNDSDDDNNDDDDDDDDDNDHGEGNSKGGDKGIVGNFISGKIAQTQAHIILKLIKIKLLLKASLAIFVIWFFITLVSILNPASIAAVLVGQIQHWIEENAPWVIEFTDFVADCWDNCVDFFTDLFGGSDDVEGEDVYEIGDYNVNDQYNDALKSNLSVIRSSYKAAYSEALDEAKAYCNDNGYDWGSSKATLSENGCGSWEDVYENCNHGDFISVANIVFEESEYEAGTWDPETFDREGFQELLLDEETLKHLYHISYVGHKDESDDDNPSYVSIYIYSYSVYDLFSMGGNDPNRKWSQTMTNVDMMHRRTDQIKAISNDENYEDYNLDATTPLNAEQESASCEVILTDNVSFENYTGTNKEVVYQYCKQKGLSDICTAAIMGNLEHENHFSTDIVQKDGDSIGLCQWSGGRKTNLQIHCDNMGVEITDINGQASFFVTEIESQMSSRTVFVGGTETNAWQAFITAEDLQMATDIFCSTFERPKHCKDQAAIDAWKAAHPKYKNARFAYTTYGNIENGFLDGKAYYIGLPQRRSYAEGFYNAILSGTYSYEE